MKTEILKTIETFLLEAGHKALEVQTTAKNHQKSDKSVVTEADLAISEMAATHLAPWLEKGHVWVDEERVDHLGSPAEVFAGNEFIWVTDPIDGTAPYANGRNTFGSIVGVLQHGAPFAGGFSLPAQGLMFVSDGTTAWLTTNAWSPQSSKTAMPAPQVTLASHTFFDVERADYGRYHSSFPGSCWPAQPQSSVHAHSNLVQGMSIGLNATGYWGIWDMVGAWPVLQALGLRWHSRNGEVLERLESSQFNEKWKMSGEWLACMPKDFTKLNEILAKAEKIA